MSLTRRRFMRVAVGGGVAVVGGSASGWRTGRRLPRVDRHEVALDDLPKALNGFRVLLLSDVHAGAFMDAGRMRDVVRFLNGLKADLVLVAGDMVDGSADASDIRAFVRAFRDLSAPHGTVAVPGNHEHYAGIGAVARELHDSPMTLLRGGLHRIESAGAGIVVLGVDDPVVGPFDQAQEAAVSAVSAHRPANHVPLLLAHRPGAFEVAGPLGIPLTLAGHTHGGQIGLGPRYLTPVRLFTKYVRGHYEEGGSHLIVSSGVGTGQVPYRLAVPPSVALVTLRTAAAT